MLFKLPFIALNLMNEMHDTNKCDKKNVDKEDIEDCVMTTCMNENILLINR